MSGSAGLGGATGGVGGGGGSPGSGGSAGTGGTAGAGGTGGALALTCRWRADFDGDGVDDCASAQAGASARLDLMFNKGVGGGLYTAAGVVTPDMVPPDYLTLVLNGRNLVFDLNHDGRQDIIVYTVVAPPSGLPYSYVQLFRGQADGTFLRYTPPSGPDGLPAIGRLTSVYFVMDFDGDGFQDLLIGSTDGGLYATFFWIVLKSTGGADLEAAQSFGLQNLRGAPYPMKLAQLNADTNVDLVMIAAPNPTAIGLGIKSYVAVALGSGDGRFSEPATQIAGTDGATDVTAGDANADGKTDLIVTLPTGPPIFYGDGAGHFSATPPP